MLSDIVFPMSPEPRRNHRKLQSVTRVKFLGNSRRIRYADRNRRVARIRRERLSRFRVGRVAEIPRSGAVVSKRGELTKFRSRIA